ncbi:alpha/beta hydrolase fold [Geomicrobium sp. JCM 19039]|nr:alpha/beta hydrolase fold [Geomicrobium sp. JCM 19039]
MIAFIFLLGTYYEIHTYQNIAQYYPPPGKQYDLKNSTIHANVLGKDTGKEPTIVIEAGIGSWSKDWQIVQQRLSAYTQVVTYDRAGYGWSSPIAEFQSAEQQTSDLRKLLNKLDIKTPIILVAHSAGGVYARMYLEEYPEDVAGLVLIDTRNEYFSKENPEYSLKMLAAETQKLNSFLAQIGFIRFLNSSMSLNHLPEEFDKQLYKDVLWDKYFFDTITEEVNNIQRLESELEPLPNNIPITVIIPDNQQMNAEELGFSQQYEQLLQQEWLKHQLSMNADRHIIAEDSSHSVMFDNPDIIVSETLHMIRDLSVEQ